MIADLLFPTGSHMDALIAMGCWFLIGALILIPAFALSDWIALDARDAGAWWRR